MVPKGGNLMVHVGILIKLTIVMFGTLRVNGMHVKRVESALCRFWYICLHPCGESRKYFVQNLINLIVLMLKQNNHLIAKENIRFCKNYPKVTRWMQ